MIVEKCARQVRRNTIEKMVVANLMTTKIVEDPFNILVESGTEMMPQGQFKNNVDSHAVGADIVYDVGMAVIYFSVIR